MRELLDVVECPGSWKLGAPNSLMRRAQDLGHTLARLRAVLEAVKAYVDASDDGWGGGANAVDACAMAMLKLREAIAACEEGR